MPDVEPWYQYPTNFSDGTKEVNGTAPFLEYADYVSAGWFAPGILLIIFMMSVGGGLLMKSSKPFLAASFITFIFSVYFFQLNILSPIWVGALLVLVVITAIGAYKERSGGY